MASVQNFTVGKFKQPFKSWSVRAGWNSEGSTVESFCGEGKCRSAGVRKREESPVYCEKKGKGVWSIFIYLLEEGKEGGMNFRCFNEESLVPAAVSGQIVGLGKLDDDCETEDDEVELSVQFLSSQLSDTLSSENNS